MKEYTNDAQSHERQTDTLLNKTLLSLSLSLFLHPPLHTHTHARARAS